jgi:hypothetical protein
MWQSIVSRGMWAGCLFGYCEPVDRRARKGARDDKMVGKRNDQRFNPLLFSPFNPHSSIYWSIASPRAFSPRDKTELLQNRPD